MFKVNNKDTRKISFNKRKSRNLFCQSYGTHISESNMNLFMAIVFNVIFGFYCILFENFIFYCKKNKNVKTLR